MSIRIRKLFGFTSVVLATLVLAACSNDDGSGATGASTSASASGDDVHAIGLPRGHACRVQQPLRRIRQDHDELRD